MYPATLIKNKREKLIIKKRSLNVIAEDELIEASLRQKCRALENNLFDEYWDELLAYRKQIGASR